MMRSAGVESVAVSRHLFHVLRERPPAEKWRGRGEGYVDWMHLATVVGNLKGGDDAAAMRWLFNVYDMAHARCITLAHLTHMLMHSPSPPSSVDEVRHAPTLSGRVFKGFAGAGQECGDKAHHQEAFRGVAELEGHLCGVCAGGGVLEDSEP
jgi:Ca2+-binding EF-hand superfamily protein